MEKISGKVFREIMEDSIRTLINWKKIENQEVTVRVVSNKDDLYGYFLPWYKDTKNFSDPLTVGEVKSNMNAMGPDHIKRVFELWDSCQFAKDTHGPAILIGCACVINKDKKILVDGCHKAVAASMLNSPFKFIIFEYKDTKYTWEGMVNSA